MYVSRTLSVEDDFVSRRLIDLQQVEQVEFGDSRDTQDSVQTRLARFVCQVSQIRFQVLAPFDKFLATSFRQRKQSGKAREADLPTMCDTFQA